jgi:hypothetical protein
MPALPAYEAFLHQAAVGLLLPILDQPGGTRRGTICGLNCRKLSQSFSGGDPNWGRIYEQVKVFQESNQPVISVDTKKRSLLEILKTQVENGSQKENRNLSKYTILWTKTWARLIHIGYTIRRQMLAGSVLVLIMTRHLLLSRVSVVGGTEWVSKLIRKPSTCL